jgi:hypothetical protein
MNRLLLILILTFSFQSLLKADDIKDLELEGMSIGDSLLDYYTVNQIKSDTDNIMNDGIYLTSSFQKNLKIYDEIQAVYNENDNKYILVALIGNIDFNDDIESCYKKQNSIIKDVSSLFKNLKKNEWGILDLELPAEYNATGTYSPVTYDFNNGDRIQISCYDFSIKGSDRLKFLIYNHKYSLAIQ